MKCLRVVSDISAHIDKNLILWNSCTMIFENTRHIHDRHTQSHLIMSDDDSHVIQHSSHPSFSFWVLPRSRTVLAPKSVFPRWVSNKNQVYVLMNEWSDTQEAKEGTRSYSKSKEGERMTWYRTHSHSYKFDPEAWWLVMLAVFYLRTSDSACRSCL